MQSRAESITCRPRVGAEDGESNRAANPIPRPVFLVGIATQRMTCVLTSLPFTGKRSRRFMSRDGDFDGNFSTLTNSKFPCLCILHWFKVLLVINDLGQASCSNVWGTAGNMSCISAVRSTSIHALIC